MEEVAKAVGGDYCRLQMPLQLALGVRETVAGHRLGAPRGGWGYAPPFQSRPPPLPLGVAPVMGAPRGPTGDGKGGGGTPTMFATTC